MADRLKKSVAEVLEMTSAELDLWAALYKVEQAEARRSAIKQKRS